MPDDLAVAAAAERRRLVQTLRVCGPTSPTLAGRWISSDLARHVAAQDRFLGLPAAGARRLVLATGWRLNKAALSDERVARLLSGWPRSWEWSLARLSQPPPTAVIRGSVAAVTLWEYWVHHEDVRRPAGIARDRHPDLFPVLPWLLRYLKPSLEGVHLRLVPDDDRQVEAGAGRLVVVSGKLSEVVLWLSGRGEVAQVDVVGPADEVSRLRRTLAV